MTVIAAAALLAAAVHVAIAIIAPATVTAAVEPQAAVVVGVLFEVDVMSCRMIDSFTSHNRSCSGGVDCDTEGDCKNRVGLSWNKWREAAGVICDKTVPVKLEVKLCQTITKPTILCRTELWAMRK